ncbi:hypothetical protein [Lysobacter capsici]|uniref:terminase small subunit-like protein n=1 Tax=Lysobacter capsici TaxID=435897 RepID=UPI001C0075CE|nr:hypothetical protein [Lysobacter capsici]QWF19291.1 hypothetical protein KME82_11395 [Lysobacter capsici]
MKPSTYTKALADKIAARLGTGETLADICRDKGMPAVRTISDWRAAHPEFDTAFLSARSEGFDAIANRVRATARGKKSKDGGDSSGDVQRDKLIIETDLKLLAKWDSRRYGDRVQLEHSGGISSLSDEQIEERLRKLMAEESGGEFA